MRGVGRFGKGRREEGCNGQGCNGVKLYEERCDDKLTADHSHVLADSPSPASPVTSWITGLCHARSTSSLTKS